MRVPYKYCLQQTSTVFSFVHLISVLFLQPLPLLSFSFVSCFPGTMPSQATDYRFLLHNWGQPKGIRPQYYDTPSGPIHRRTWKTGVHLNTFESKEVGVGWGTSRATSRENAALSVLKHLQIPLTTRPDRDLTQAEDEGPRHELDYARDHRAETGHQFNAGGATISSGGDIASRNITVDGSGNTVVQHTVNPQDSASTSRVVIGALAASNVILATSLAYTVHKVVNHPQHESAPISVTCNTLAPQLPIGVPDSPTSSSISATDNTNPRDEPYSWRTAGSLTHVQRLADNNVLPTMSIALPLSRMIFPKDYKRTRKSIKRIGLACGLLSLVVPLVIGVG